MAFTKALYYPWIEIKNEIWLKNAMFYWDTIQTIVPESIKQPYKNNISKEFHENGYLIPLKVNSNMKEIKLLEQEVIKYLDTNEATNVLLRQTVNNEYKIYKEKLPAGLRMARLYPEKLPFDVRHTLSKYFKEYNDSFLVDEKFASFYMTLLSTTLAEKKHVSLLTDRDAYGNLSDAVRFDNNIRLTDDMHDRFYRNLPNSERNKHLKEGILSQLLMQKININKETTPKKIIDFKNKYKDELGRYRSKIGELSKSITLDNGVESIKQQIYDMVLNEIEPAYSDLKNALKSNKIKFFEGGFLKVAYFSVPATCATVLLGVPAPLALFVGMGLSLIAQTKLYNTEKQNILNKNPYSYLMKIEEKFT